MTHGYRPAALKFSNSTDDAEMLVYNTEFTTMFHIFVSIAAACFAWLFLIKPFYAQNWPLIAFWAIVIPIIMLSTDVLSDSILSKTDKIFVYLKFISVWVAILAICYFMRTKDIKFIRYIIPLIFLVNILEAAFDQIINRKEDSTDITNGVIGFLIAITVAYTMYSGGRVAVINENGANYVAYNLSIWIILAYTFWNILFRSFVVKNTGTLFFSILSLGLPLVSEYLYPNSWFHARALTLFLYIVLVLGLNKKDGRILPMYNEQGYIQDPDSVSALSSIQGQMWYKVLMIVLSFVCLVIYLIKK